MHEPATIIIVILSILLIIISFLLIRNKNENKKLKYQNKKDVIETNILLLKKSENELKLFFEFEAAVEETIKIGRKSLALNKEILIKQKEITEQLKAK